MKISEAMYILCVKQATQLHTIYYILNLSSLQLNDAPTCMWIPEGRQAIHMSCMRTFQYTYYQR